MNGKHQELVWQVTKCVHNFRLNFNQVKWAPDNDDGYLNFHSISGDGRVSNWTLVKVEHIYCQALMHLTQARIAFLSFEGLSLVH